MHIIVVPGYITLPEQCSAYVRQVALSGAGKKFYTLEGHEAELSKLADQRVTIKGILKGDMLYVQEVAASK